MGPDSTYRYPLHKDVPRILGLKEGHEYGSCENYYDCDNLIRTQFTKKPYVAFQENSILVKFNLFSGIETMEMDKTVWL